MGLYDEGSVHHGQTGRFGACMTGVTGSGKTGATTDVGTTGATAGVDNWGNNWGKSRHGVIRSSNYLRWS